MLPQTKKLRTRVRGNTNKREEAYVLMYDDRRYYESNTEPIAVAESKAALKRIAKPIMVDDLAGSYQPYNHQPISADELEFGLSGHSMAPLIPKVQLFHDPLEEKRENVRENLKEKPADKIWELHQNRGWGLDFDPMTWEFEILELGKVG